MGKCPTREKAAALNKPADPAPPARTPNQPPAVTICAPAVVASQAWSPGRGAEVCSARGRSGPALDAQQGSPPHTQRLSWFRRESLWQLARQLSAEKRASAPCGATGLGLRSAAQADLLTSGALWCPPRPPVHSPCCPPPEFAPMSAPTARSREQQRRLPAGMLAPPGLGTPPLTGARRGSAR